MANGRKRNGKWVDRWREGGHHRQRTFDRRGDRDVVRAERIPAPALGGVVRLEHPVTLAEFMEDYWRLHARRNLEPATRATYLQQWGKHIRPRLGDYELRSIDRQLINASLVEPMLRSGRRTHPAPGPRESAVDLHVRAGGGRVADNPVRRVTKPRQAGGREVPPVPPATVERVRARVGARDALMISVLAYAGLRPQELLALRWDDIAGDAIVVRRKNVDGALYPYTKTRQNRRVKLLAPLGADLAEWKLATGRRDGLVLPRADGEPWREHDWRNWRRRIYQRNAAPLGLSSRSRWTCRC